VWVSITHTGNHPYAMDATYWSVREPITLEGAIVILNSSLDLPGSDGSSGIAGH